MVITTLVAVSWVAFKLAVGHYPVAPWFTETYAAVLAATLSMLAVSALDPAKPVQLR